MKGRQLRPDPAKIPRVLHTMRLTPVARIVRDTADSALDGFIPLEVAKQRCIDGSLTELDMGPEFPDSYLVIS